MPTTVLTADRSRRARGEDDSVDISAAPSQLLAPVELHSISRQSSSLTSLTNWLQHPGVAPENHRRKAPLASRHELAVAAEEARRALEEARVELSETRAQLDDTWRHENENALLDELLQTAAEAVSMEVSQPISEIRFVETSDTFHREGLWDARWASMLQVLDDGIGSMTVAMGEDAAKAGSSRFSSPVSQKLGTPQRLRAVDDRNAVTEVADGQQLRVADRDANKRLSGVSTETLAEEARAVSESLQEDDSARAEAGRRLFRLALMMILG